jgi:hypothetical protein
MNVLMSREPRVRLFVLLMAGCKNERTERHRHNERHEIPGFHFGYHPCGKPSPRGSVSRERLSPGGLVCLLQVG